MGGARMNDALIVVLTLIVLTESQHIFNAVRFVWRSLRKMFMPIGNGDGD